MEKLPQLLRQAEVKWLSCLYSFCKKKFENVNLQSHDQTHHLRVWLRAKELLEALSLAGSKISGEEAEGLLVSCLFHDIGMTHCIGKNHGSESRRICEDFFKEHASLKPAGWKGILNAIEAHHEKRRDNEHCEAGEITTNTVSLLSISDDLDAFGYLGVFRYAEIYILRGMKIAELGGSVLDDLMARCKNVSCRCGNLGSFGERHSERYEATRAFYETLVKQMDLHGDPKNTYEGALGVLNYFQKYIWEDNALLLHLPGIVLSSARDHYVSGFFKNLASELHSLPSVPEVI